MGAGSFGVLDQRSDLPEEHMVNPFMPLIMMQTQMLGATLQLTSQMAMMTAQSQAQLMRAFLPKAMPTTGLAAACMPFNLRS